MKNKGERKRGLQKRILTLCIGIVIASTILFAVLGVIQLSALIKLIRKSDDSQAKVIKSESSQALTELLEYGLIESVERGAEYADGTFWTLNHDFEMLSRQVEDVFSNPDNYKELELNPPKKENAGKLVLQTVYADWTDPNDEEAFRMARKLSNLAPMMAEMIRGNSEDIMDCYIALPSGITLEMDELSDQKLNADGSAMTYDATEKYWYEGAEEDKKMYYSPIIHRHYNDEEVVVFGMPVYVDGELVAVLGGSTKLDEIKEILAEKEFVGGAFSILVDGEGNIIYSPKEEGTLSVGDGESIPYDIRERGNFELNQVYEGGLNDEVGFAQVIVDGVFYYLAFAPLKSVGWVQMIFVPNDELQEPVETLLTKIDEIKQDNMENFGAEASRSMIRNLILVIILVIISAVLAGILSKRIVTPIITMTKRVSGMEGDDIRFEMEDVYRTGDEIEVLAGRFSTLTARIRDYIEWITKASADKERMDAEMGVANKIQAAMLPRTFPAFPDRHEFDLFAAMEPAKQVGGDLYDYYFIDDDHLAILIGDVSGKGVTAALFMVMTKHIIQSQMMLKQGNVVEALTEANSLLMAENAAKMFVTVLLGVLNVNTGEFVYVNSGHEYPAICRKEGGFTAEKDQHGPPLATTKRLKFKLNELKLEPGDILYLYTDGIPEAINEKEEMFGKEKMLQVLSSNKELSPMELDGAVRSAVKEFSGDAEQFDDITSLCIKFLGKE